MDTSILEDLGLSKGEVKVYISLLELGTTKVGSIIKKSEMASSAVHNALNTLLEKGLISYVQKGKIKYYMAADPKHFLSYIDEKKKRFKLILPEILQKQKREQERMDAEVYFGYKGIMTLLLEGIKDAKRGEETVFFSADVEPINKEIQDFFRRYDPIRKAKCGTMTKGLAPLRLKYLFEDRANKGFLKMRYTDNPLPPNMTIFKNAIALFTWGEKPVGYLIYSKQLAEKYRKFFNFLWERCK